MKKFKDFIYDKNDIIIAVLILAVAALIIFWRLNVILEYPKQLLGNDEPNVENPVDNTGDNSAGTDKPADSSDNSNSGAGSNSDNTANDNEPADNTQELPLWQGGVLTKDVEVEVSGNSASAAIKCLIDKELFDDYAEYQRICDETGLDHEKVKAGTFTFKKGSTKQDIAKKMNWG